MLHVQRGLKLVEEAIEALRNGDPITARSKCLFAHQELGNYLAADDDTMLFPIQGKTSTTRPVRHLRQSWVPLWLAEIAYEYYAEQYGTGQSLKRLAERGGFGRDELVQMIRRGELEEEKP